MDLALRRRYGELGYLGVNLDSSVGGGGMSHLDAVIVLEEVAKISIAVAFPIFEACFGPVWQSPTSAANHSGSVTCPRSVPGKSRGSVHVRARRRICTD